MSMTANRLRTLSRKSVFNASKCWFSAGYAATINPKLLQIEKTTNPQTKMSYEFLKFGKSFTDHMLEIDWDEENGWSAPKISPYHYFTISPAATALHYGIECFEGMKAYKDQEGNVRMFRPMKNMDRLNSSMARLAMPTFNGEGFLECLKELLRLDADWVPGKVGYSMYIRPTAIGTSPYLGVEASKHIKLYAIMSPVGPYYKSGFQPIKLFADTKNTRAWPGGVGSAKVGGNYGPTIQPSKDAAEQHGCSQVLWLYGEDHQITEVGAMNIFFVIRDKATNRVELITAPLTRGDILAGVTRDSILSLAREEGSFGGHDNVKVSERWITMKDVVEAEQDGRLLEAFGAGTAVVISPVKSILYKDKEIKVPTGEHVGPIAKYMWDKLLDIQYGFVDHPWSEKI